MKTRLAVLAVLSALAAPVAFAQGTAGASPAPAGSQMRIGILGARQAVVATAEGKLAQAELQSQFAPRQSELENMRKQMQDIQTRGQAQTTPDDERTRLARQLDGLNRTYQRKLTELQEDVQAAEGEVFDRIGRKMVEVVERYSRENGLGAVIDSSLQAGQFWYVAPTLDITQDIVRLYDAAHPVRAAGAQTPARPAATPGQTRPPAKPPQQ